MVKQHHQLLKFGLGIIDGLTVSAAWFLAYAIRFSFFSHAKSLPSMHSLIEGLILTLAIAAAVFSGTGLYKPRRDRRILEELQAIIVACVVCWVVLIASLYYLRNTPFTRGMLLALLPTLMAMLVLERTMFRSVLRFARNQGWNQRYAIIVGVNRLGQRLLETLRDNSWTGLKVIGFVSVENQPLTGGHIRGISIVGPLAELPQIIRTMRPDCVFVALRSHEAALLPQVVAQLDRTSVDVRVVPDLRVSRYPVRVSISELDGMPIVSLRENPLAGWSALYKRAFDIGGALLGLAVFALPMAIIALMIKRSGSGPVIYRQRRISFGGQPFDIFKFRTMIPTAENACGAVLASPGDPRCTRLGRWLRRTSLGELPQLFNVLKGDMSLVGPRPERPEIMEKIVEEIPGFATRLKMRAGITGYAQVRGYRGRTSFRKRLQYDLYYLNHWSPLLDLRILVETLIRGFRHPTAY
jgi:exopolysaccharide biosynthesis polyprenyl glycosylphosphotransferase